jgi:hypothetical protein
MTTIIASLSVGAAAIIAAALPIVHTLSGALAPLGH